MRRIAFFLMSIYCFTACNNELADIPVNPEDNSNPPIELILPDVEQVNVYSTATTSENTIDTLWVIIFNGTTKKWVEKIEGSKIVRNGNATQLLPQLKHKPNDGDSIICIANVDPSPDTTFTTITPTTINDRFLLMSKRYYSGTERLPMYGAFEWSDMGGTICLMRRAVAKIQVQMGTSVSDVTIDFIPDKVTFSLHNGPIGGFIKPTSPLGKPGSPPGNETDRYYLLQNSAATEKTSNLYVPEYHSATNALGTTIPDTQFDVNRQHLLLHHAKAPNDTTFYRLDFYDNVTNKYLDVKRNYHYLFTIDKVRSEGYPSRAQAQNNPGSNLEYTIYVSDGSKDVVSNGQYAIVVNIDTAIQLMPSTTMYYIGTVRYVIPTEMSTVYGGTWNTSPNSVTVSVTSSTPMNPSAFSLSAPMTIANGYQTIMLNVATGITSAVGEITFQLGNITFTKPIKFY